MKLLTIILLIICIIICVLKLKEKSKKNYLSIFLLFIILLTYIILSFGISFSSKTTYNMKKMFSGYEYKESYKIDNNLVLVISEKKSNEESNYNLSLQNKFIGLYVNNDRKYTQGIMVTGNDELDVNYIIYNVIYYYYFNSYKGIENVCINDQLYDILELQTYVFVSDKRIESLEINYQNYYPYYVQLEFN